MDSIEEKSISAAEPHARVFWISMLAIVLVLIVLMLRPEALPASVIAGLLLLGALIVAFSSFGVWRTGRKVSYGFGAWLGLVYLVGGVAFDVYATVIHSPDLAREMNVVARKWLDSGFSVSTVYVLGGVLQTLVVLMAGSCWLGFIRHRETFIHSCAEFADLSLLNFIKAASGGGKLSWRAYLFPLRMSEAPSFYHLFWLMIPVNFGGATYRWYLGLEWFGLVPYADRTVLCSVCVVIALGIYVRWLTGEHRRMSSAHADDPSERE